VPSEAVTSKDTPPGRDAVVVENGSDALPVADGRASGVQQVDEKRLVRFGVVIAVDRNLDARLPGTFIDPAAIEESPIVIGRIRAAVGCREFESDPTGRSRRTQANVEKNGVEASIPFRGRNVTNRQHRLRNRLRGPQRRRRQQQPQRARSHPGRHALRCRGERGGDARAGRTNGGLRLHRETSFR
jgi:hypothetical protein